MRATTVPTEISWHQALNAIEKIVRKASDDDKARFGLLDVQRIQRVKDEVFTWVRDRENRELQETLRKIRGE